VWQLAVSLTVEIYKMTAHFPSDERFGLAAQMRRAAVSIPSNLAEGSRRKTHKDFRKFVLIASGSGAELETQIALVERLSQFIATDVTPAKELLYRIMQMLTKLD